MIKIVFATNNQNKLKEVREALPQYDVVGLKDIGCFEELAEYTNAIKQKMVMKREVIADKGIWTAKKRYIKKIKLNRLQGKQVLS